jgi:uncharacterized protein (DUF4415 family)
MMADLQDKPTTTTDPAPASDKPMTSLLDQGWTADGKGGSGEPKADPTTGKTPDEASLTPEQKAEADAKAKADAEAKAKATADAGKAVPEKYEAKMPEGMTLDTDMVEKFTPVLKELGITQEGFQKLADAYAPVITERVTAAVKQQNEASQAEFQKEVNGWGDKTKEIYGSNLQSELVAVSKGLDRVFAGNQQENIEFRGLMAASGLGNHPLMVKALSFIGKSISEGSVKEGKPISGGEPKTAAEVMYPNMK